MTSFSHFKPPIMPGQGSGKNRPALILSVADGSAIAVAVKITSSTPTQAFPNRIKITQWSEAGLDNQSYVEIDSEITIHITGHPQVRGELEESDFNNVLVEYLKLKSKSKPQSWKTNMTP